MQYDQGIQWRRGSNKQWRKWWRCRKMFGEPCAQKLMIWSWPTLEATRLEEPWCHPSSPWDAQEASSRVQSKKETALIIDTKHGSLLRSRHLRQSKNHGDRPLEPCYSLVNQWWWPWSQGRTTLHSKDHMIEIIDIFGRIHKKILFSSMSSPTSEAKSRIFFDIQNHHSLIMLIYYPISRRKTAHILNHHFLIFY